MAVNADGTGTCDNCGTVYPNGGIDTFLIVSDMIPNNPGYVETLLFCRPNKCDKLIRRRVVLGHYRQPRQAPVPEPVGDGGG